MSLSTESRQAVWADWMRASYGPVAATKPQLRAAVDAADDWVDANLADFTAELPESLRAGFAPTVLLANAGAIARGAEIADVSAGIADRSQSAAVLAGYNAATAWLTANAVGFLTAVGAACDGTLTQGQSFAVLESVCRRRVL